MAERHSPASQPARQRRRLENTPEAGAIRAVGVPRTQRSSVFGASLQVAEKRTLEDIDGDRALGGAVSAATDRELSDRRRPTSWRSLETVGAHVEHRRGSLYPRHGSRVPSRHRLPASSCERQGPAAGTCNNHREPAAAEAPTRTERVQVVVDLASRASLYGVGRCSFLGSLHEAPASDGPETVACALLSAEPVVRTTDQRRRRDGVGGGAWPRLGARSGVSLQPIRAKRGGDHAASRAGASDRAGHRGACCPRALPRGVSGSSDECTGASCTSSLSRPPAAS